MSNAISSMYAQGLSIREIARKIGKSPTFVNNQLKRLKVPLRSHSEAQKNALAQGKVDHPTKGKKLSEDTKAAIGESLTKYNESLTQQEKDAQSLEKSKRWANRQHIETANMTNKGHKSIRRTADTGSSMERFFCHKLTENGIDYQFHCKSPHGSSTLEVDIMLPGRKIAIEVDGPSHYIPIWGDDKLAATKESDLKKNGLLLGLGYMVIRLQYKKVGTRPSKTRLNSAAAKLLAAISQNHSVKVLEIEI